MFKQCPICKKKFDTERKDKIYCSNRCYNLNLRKIRYNGKYKFLVDMKKTINDIRVGFDFMRAHYPKRAKKLLEQMKKEEDEEFIELALNGFKTL